MAMSEAVVPEPGENTEDFDTGAYAEVSQMDPYGEILVRPTPAQRFDRLLRRAGQYDQEDKHWGALLFYQQAVEASSEIEMTEELEAVLRTIGEKIARLDAIRNEAPQPWPGEA